MYASQARLGSLRGVLQPCADSWFEDDEMGRTNWCQDRDSQSGDPIGEPYIESRSVRTHVDARSEVVNMPGAQPGEGYAVNFQSKTEYIVPFAQQPPNPATQPGAFNQYVIDARQGPVLQELVGAGEVTQAPRMVPGGTFDPRRDYQAGVDPRTGLQYTPEEDPALAVLDDFAPAFFEDAAYGGGPAGRARVGEDGGTGSPISSPLVLAGLGLLLFATTRKKSRGR